MSRSEGKSEVQVTHPGQAFPFSSVTSPPHPHISQWCRFSIPERLPLQPFRQDRLNRLPLPPGVMATSKVINAATVNNFTSPGLSAEKRNGGIDPYQKIQQLEKNLVFVRENHVFMLKGLHEEIAELKQKNRELLFELVTGVPAIPKKESKENRDGDSSEDQQDKIDKLEKEIKRLRSALRDAMKANSSLTNKLEDLKREHYAKHSSRNVSYNQVPPDNSAADERAIGSPCGPSPQLDEYSDTLRQIQRASTHRNGKHDGRHDWSDNYSRSGNHYRRHHHHRNHPQNSPQQQPRLPRLPLRNQQNYVHPQFEIHYQQRSTNTLPALVPVVDPRLDKPRKSRGPRPPKIADQVTNG